MNSAAASINLDTTSLNTEDCLHGHADLLQSLNRVPPRLSSFKLSNLKSGPGSTMVPQGWAQSEPSGSNTVDDGLQSNSRLLDSTNVVNAQNNVKKKHARPSKPTNDDGIAVKNSQITEMECPLDSRTFPTLDPSLAARGITSSNCTLLVDILPANYPSQHYVSQTAKKWQISFLYFSGPDPPPSDIGSPGDIYVSPAASALYGCLPVEGATKCRTWKRWGALRSADSAREVKLNDSGIVGHPYLPGYLLWPVKSSFGWYSLKTVNNTRRDVRSSLENENAEAVTKILIERTLQLQEGKIHGKTGRKRPSTDGWEEPQKKARPSPCPEPTAKMVAEISALKKSHEEQATSIERLEAENATLKKSHREQATSMEQLEAKHAALKKLHTASMQRLQAEYAALKNSHGEQATSIKRLEAANAALKSAVDEASKTQQQKPDRMPFHPEFLDFMRETLTLKEFVAVERIAAESAASDARVQIAALEAKIRGLDYAAQNATPHDTNALCMPQSMSTEAEDRLAALEAENEDLMAAAVRDTATLHRAEACISDQQNKIAAL
ncbi:hypothetical protein MSAN_01371000 [Mycena sanguinolenta]|uniref:Uncharacterized protein n=1 Tax=Mycena sanguinolenta TaxID=230812 RepID=A0A8H6Y7C7_9AGAR|nr:hypothetical protein MSAN_01371000 [Mycena sanguinolenta]